MSDYEHDDRAEEESNFEEYKYLCSVEAFAKWVRENFDNTGTVKEMLTDTLVVADYKDAIGIPQDQELHGE